MSMQVPSILFSPTTQTQATTAIRPSVPAGPPSGQPAATTSVSPWAVLLSKLEQLQRSDPEAFGQVTAQMAGTVATNAASAGGEDKQALTKLADQLNEASKTGNLSAVKPPKHHHHQAAASQGGSALPSLLQSLLDQIDHVLGPDATSAADM
jgi:hypothetical protein